MKGGYGVAWRRVALTTLLLAASSATALGQSTECDAGEREVRSLEFRGNSVFRSSDLALRIVTSPSEFLRRSIRIVGAKHCLDSDELRLDVARLRVFYRRHGYFSTRVDTAVTPLVDGYGGVRVAFLIAEGEPMLVDTLRISGLDSTVAPIADTASLGLKRGMIFDAARIQTAIDSIKTRLRDNGYPRGDVAASYRVDTLTRRATVYLDVIRGLRARVGAIRIHADPIPGEARRMSDETIRSLIDLREGELYRERRLIDTQRSLYQADLFRHVEVGLAPDSLSRDSIVAVQVVVTENYLRHFDTEEGWAVLDCFKGRVQYIDKNFLGNARRLDVSAQVSKIGYGQPTRFAAGGLCAPAIRRDTFSAKLNYFAGATLRLQSLFGVRASPTFSLYSERRGEYQAFLRTTLVGGEASVLRDLLERVPLRLGYSLEYGRTEAQPALMCAIFNRCDSESRAQITDRDRPLAVASAHLERLRADNPVNPRSGTALRLDLRGASKAIGSDPDVPFVKGLLDAAVYQAAGPIVTFSARLRLGTVLGRTLSLSDTVGFIPPQERLYAGGAGSVRGYQQNEVGDLIYIAEENYRTRQGTGDTAYYDVEQSSGVRRVVPVGGNSLIVLNMEARIRSPFYPELIQYTVFADAGDVWQRGRTVGVVDHKASALWLNGLKWTPGVGVRVSTPVGPFQANVGYNPFIRPAGPIYFDQAPTALGFAPLYCVSPGNLIPVVPGRFGPEQPTGSSCPGTFTPSRQAGTFLSHLTFTFSIGPDF
ncbi:MAG: BamA/TamA family outer membrane protein [Gemmatimonadota bacterium]